MDFGEKLKDFAIKNFGGIKQLADLLGIADTALHRYINGSVSPSKSFFVKMRELCCDLNWLLGNENCSKDSSIAPSIYTELDKLRKENKNLMNLLEKIKKSIP